MQSDVSTIKDRINIVDVVGEYVRLIKTGTNFKARCPFHEEKTPSFVVTEDRQTYHCFGCNTGGDVLSFIMEIEGMEFREALELLAVRAGVELQKYTPQQKKVQDERSRLYEAQTQSVAFYEKQLHESTAGKKALLYLTDRGISVATLQKFHIGYAPDGWHHSEQFLVGRGFAPKELATAGLLIQKNADRGQSGFYDRFRHRIMFPINDVLGRSVGFSARALPSDDPNNTEQNPGAKYINTPESPLYHKSEILYGADLAKQAVKRENHVILVEGNMDVVAAHEAGIENVVGVSGTALTDNHIKILKRYTTNFVLFFDADSAGQKAAYKSAQMCLRHDIDFSLVSLDGGKDAADLVKENPQHLRDAVAGAKKAIDFFITKAVTEHDLNDPHGKRTAVEEVLSLAAYVAHPIEQAEWVKKCAAACEIDLATAQQTLEQYAAQHKLQFKGKKPHAKASPIQKIAQPSPTQLAAAVSEITRMALAFPQAWQVLEQNASQYTFVEGHVMLTKIITEGPQHNYDAQAFLEKHSDDASGKYHAVSSYAEQFMRTHESTDLAGGEIIHFMKRAQTLHDKALLIEYTNQVKDAEHKGDSAKRDQYMQKIIDISTKKNE